MKQTTIKTLLETHPAEHHHLAHVTALAMKIFSGVAPLYGLNHIDKKILRAAALLHDIGYSVRPDRHVSTGLALLKKIRLKECTPAQQQLVLAVISLHRKVLPPSFRTSELKKVRQPGRALLLGAILRVADGLDHSHIQDARIERMDVHPDSVTLHIQTGWHTGNIAWAEQKADLWNGVLDRPLRFVPVPCPPPFLRLAGIVAPDDLLLEAARSLLYAQYRLAADNLDGTCQESDPRFLHDLRVALRRAKVLFDFFRPELKDLEAREHRDFLAKITASLSAGRDAQEWLALLDEAATKNLSFTQTSSWPDFYARERRKILRKRSHVKAILTHPGHKRALRELAFFLRSELPRHIAESHPRDLYRPFAARRLLKQLDRLLQQKIIRDDTPPDVAHEVRKLVRKTRYYAEFAEPVLPPEIHSLTVRLKALADALGAIQDIHVHLDYMKRNPDIRAPRALESRLRQKLAKSWLDYKNNFTHLCEPAYQNSIRQALQAAST